MSARVSRRQAYDDNEESIYGLIPPPEASEQRSAMYRSKFPHDTPPTGSTFGPASSVGIATSNLGGAFGLPNTHQYYHTHSQFGSKTAHHSDPKTFLKKHSNPALPEPTRRPYSDTRKPALDNTISEAATRRSVSPQKKNFISSNALSVIFAQAKKPQSTTMDYTKKPDYGRVPAYLSKVKQDVATEREYIKSVLSANKEEDAKNQPKLVLLPEEERIELVESLKGQWESINKVYQLLTHNVTLDSSAKIRRKEEYEIQLAEIEKSIEKLSKKHVYVQSN